MLQCNNVEMQQYNNGTMELEQWNNGTMKPRNWNNGTMEQHSKVTMKQWNN